MDRRAMLIVMFLLHGILMGMYGLGERREAYMEGVEIGMPYAFDTNGPAECYAKKIGSDEMTYEEFLAKNAKAIERARAVYNAPPHDREALKRKYHPQAIAGWWQEVHAKMCALLAAQ